MIPDEVIRLIQETYQTARFQELQERAEAAEARVNMLEAANRNLSARIAEAEEENRKLMHAMVQVKQSECPEKCTVVYEMEYSGALSSPHLGNVAVLVFKELMKKAAERGGPNE